MYFLLALYQLSGNPVRQTIKYTSCNSICSFQYQNLIVDFLIVILQTNKTMPPHNRSVVLVPTSPFEGQKPGTSGLRKTVKVESFLYIFKYISNLSEVIFIKSLSYTSLSECLSRSPVTSRCHPPVDFWSPFFFCSILHAWFIDNLYSI